MNDASARRLEDLILARSAVRAKTPPTPSAVSKALHPALARRFTKAEWDQAFVRAVASLRAQELIEEKRLTPTPAGLSRLQSALGLKQPPAARTWAEFKKAYLPRLLLPDTGAAEGAKINPSVAVLAGRLGVPLEPKSTASTVVNAWIARTFDFPQRKKVDFGALRAALLARELKLPARGGLGDVASLAAATLSGATSGKSEAVLDGLVLRWLFGDAAELRDSSVSGAGSEHDLSRFVAKVNAVSEGPGVRRYGPNKVFIASVWETLGSDPEFAALDQAGFKRLLLEAHRQGLLVLSRADLVAAMDPKDVTASETTHQNATYHFIQRGASA
jgi:hypothetical protein